MSLPAIAIIVLIVFWLYFSAKKKNPEANTSCCIFDKILAPLYNLFNEYYSNSGLIVEDVKDDCVVCNTPYPNLYAIKLEGCDNVNNYLDKTTINTIIRDYARANDAYIFYVILKRGKYQRQYIFSHNKGLLQNIAKFYSLNLMSGNEIANTILELFLQNDYKIENKKLIPTSFIDFNEERAEPTFLTFQNIIKTLRFKALKEVKIYQAYQFIKGTNETNIQQLFREDFEGTIWNFISFSDKHIKNHIDKIVSAASWTGNKQNAKTIKESYDAGTPYLLTNSVMFMKKNNDSIIGALGNCIKNAYIPQELNRRNIIQKTPVKHRNGEFDFLVESDYLEKYITAIHKKIPKNPDIFGLDKNQAHTAYSFSEENEAPFFCFIASAGSGKSLSKQHMMAQMINLDFRTGEAKNLGKNIKVRAYDVGYSDENFVNFVKSNPKNNVTQLESTIGSFKYNICYINSTGSKDEIEADIQFAADLVSIIRQSQNQNVLTLPQAIFFKDILRKLYTGEIDYEFYKVNDLKNTHEEIFNKLINLGYKISTRLRDIQESEFDFLKVPLIQDIKKYSEIQASNQQIAQIDRDTYRELAAICSDLDKEKVFNTFDNVPMTDTDFLSFDLNNFKESSLYLPIFLSVFQKTYLRDREYALKCKREKIKAPKLLYLVEEAANFFRIKYFEVMLEKVVLEARKYNVHLCFIVQNAEHIPQGVLKNISTRIFLLAPAKKDEVVQEVKQHFSPGEKVIEALRNTDKYEMCIWYSQGVFNLKFELNEEEMALYNTNPNLTAEPKKETANG